MGSTAKGGTLALVVAFAAVLAAMVALFALPSRFFVGATFFATGVMTIAALATTRYRALYRPGARSLLLGAVSAALLYGVFYAGNALITTYRPLGIGPGSEGSIYGLIASPSNPLPLQAAVLVFDAVGYESFFRGALQTRLQGRAGVGSVFLVALLDASIHLVSMNPLWVSTTFIADSAWGLTYYYGGDLGSSVTSHLLWDVAIFIVAPIK